MPSKDFKFLEHTADLEFIAYGDSLSECFQNAALATWSSILDLDLVTESMEKEIYLESEDLTELLHDFLSETLFLFETQNLVFKSFDVSIDHDRDNKYKLTSTISGEEFDSEKHLIELEIKAVTYHRMEIEQEEGRWSARVICDI